jgi:hypothetical protein
MTISRPRPDILIRSPEGYPIAVVEIYNRLNLSRDIATKLRRNLIDYGMPLHVPYFLLLSQDVGFLWKEPNQEDLNAPPAYEFPMNKVVARYLRRGPNERLYGEELELLALQWLTDLSAGSQKAIEEPEKTLALAGFNDSIRGATILGEEEQ